MVDITTKVLIHELISDMENALKVSERPEEYGAVFGHKVVAGQLGKDVDAADDQRPLPVRALKGLFPRFLVGGSSYRAAEAGEFFLDPLVCEAAHTQSSERGERVVVAAL